MVAKPRRPYPPRLLLYLFLFILALLLAALWVRCRCADGGCCGTIGCGLREAAPYLPVPESLFGILGGYILPRPGAFRALLRPAGESPVVTTTSPCYDNFYLSCLFFETFVCPPATLRRRTRPHYIRDLVTGYGDLFDICSADGPGGLLFIIKPAIRWSVVIFARFVVVEFCGGKHHLPYTDVSPINGQLPAACFVLYCLVLFSALLFPLLRRVLIEDIPRIYGLFQRWRDILEVRLLAYWRLWFEVRPQNFVCWWRTWVEWRILWPCRRLGAVIWCVGFRLTFPIRLVRAIVRMFFCGAGGPPPTAGRRGRDCKIGLFNRRRDKTRRR